MNNKHIEPYRHRFEIKKCETTSSYKVVDPKSGVEIYPSCGEDAAGFHAYLRGKGNLPFADDMLEDILNGKKPISQMKLGIEIMRARA